MALRKRKKQADPNKPITLQDHIQELRSRLAYCAAALLVGGGLGYVFHEEIVRFIRSPLQETLYFSSPAGNFNFIMNICMLTGLVVAIPVIAYNILAFTTPALPGSVLAKRIKRMTFFSFVLAVCGMVFAFFIIIPSSLRFFLGFNLEGVESIITVDSYLSFIISCLISFMLIFQIPLIMSIIDRIKPIPPSKLLKYERHVVIGSLAFALALPFTYDPLTMFIIASPMLILYNLSIITIFITHRGRPVSEPSAVVATTEPIEPEVAPEPRALPKLSMLPSQILPELAFVSEETRQPNLIHDVVRQSETAGLHYQM